MAEGIGRQLILHECGGGCQSPRLFLCLKFHFMKQVLSLFLLVISHTLFAQLNPEQESIRQTFFSFLKFYEQNQRTFNGFRVYKGKGQYGEPPYRIQWQEAERYFAWLRKQVPYVGEAYITAERRHFQVSDSLFRAYPDEEIPMGFDYDRWAGGQEDIKYTRPYYTSPKNKYRVIINGDKAELRIGGVLPPGAGEDEREWSVVPFAKEKGKWKMAGNVVPLEQYAHASFLKSQS